MKHTIILLAIILCGVNVFGQTYFYTNNDLENYSKSLSLSPNNNKYILSPDKTTSRSQKFYRKIDLESGNLYSWATFSIVGGLINMASKNVVCENAFLISSIKAKSTTGDLKTEKYRFNEVSAKDLFSDLKLGGRLGYISEFGSFNAGFYGSVHYRINRFKIEDKMKNNLGDQNIQRLLLGLCGLIRIGDITGESGVITYFEAGLRYSVATKYESPYSTSKSDINNGIVSHWAVYLQPSPTCALQNVGLFVDINHFNLLNDKKANPINLAEINTWTLGIKFAIAPTQAKYR